MVHATGLKYCEHLLTCPHLDNPAVCWFFCFLFFPLFITFNAIKHFCGVSRKVRFLIACHVSLRKGTKSLCSDPRCTFFVPYINFIRQCVCVCVFRPETFGDHEGYLWLFSSVAPNYGRQKWWHAIVLVLVHFPTTEIFKFDLCAFCELSLIHISEPTRLA